MIDTGQLLRQTREAQELSLADVEEQTRIRQRYLSALESDDWEVMPNEVVGRGFLRTYADFLGLNSAELVAQRDTDQAANGAGNGNGNGAAKVAAVAKPGPPSDYQPIELDIYENTVQRSRRVRRVLGFVLSLIPVLILAFLIVQYGLPLLLDQTGGSGGQASTVVALPPEGTPPETPVIVVVETPGPNASDPGSVAGPTRVLPPTFTPTRAPSPTPTASPTPASDLTLRINVSQRSWLRVDVDGETMEEGVVEPNYMAEYVAQQKLEILVGNAAGVELGLNGEPLPPLGKPGEIVAFIWTLENGAIVVSTPTPAPETTASPTQKAGKATPQKTTTPDSGDAAAAESS